MFHFRAAFLGKQRKVRTMSDSQSEAPQRKIQFHISVPGQDAFHFLCGKVKSPEAIVSIEYADRIPASKICPDCLESFRHSPPAVTRGRKNRNDRLTT